MEASTEVVVGNDRGGTGENSDDECCLCGKLWDNSCTGWPLCDTPDCPNVCCASCSEALIVADLFYCPICAGSGTNAAAAVGGSIATSIKVCSELDTLPLSQNAIKAILRNLIKKPNEPKYRKLRLNNPKVKSLLDLDPCRRLLTIIGFMQRQDEENEPVFFLEEGKVDIEEMKQLLDILEGVSQEDESRIDGKNKMDDSSSDKEDSTTQTCNVAISTNSTSKQQKRSAPRSFTPEEIGDIKKNENKDTNTLEFQHKPSPDTETKRQKCDEGKKQQQHGD